MAQGEYQKWVRIYKNMSDKRRTTNTERQHMYYAVFQKYFNTQKELKELQSTVWTICVVP